MQTRFLVAGAIAVLMAHPANATVYFDSTTVANLLSGSDGRPDNNTYEAASFTAATPAFSQLSLSLSDTTPSDAGSIFVYLVPDNGAGGANGVAGAPVTIAPASSQLIGTISDAKLSSTPSPTTLFFSPPAVSLATANQEYWVELDPSNSSNGMWEYGAGGSFAGSAGQKNLDTVFPNPSADVVGTYDLVVATPEPTSLAILGAGLACLGFFRRPSEKKA